MPRTGRIGSADRVDPELLTQLTETFGSHTCIIPCESHSIATAPERTQRDQGLPVLLADYVADMVPVFQEVFRSGIRVGPLAGACSVWRCFASCREGEAGRLDLARTRC